MESKNIKKKRLARNQQKYYKRKYEDPEFREKEKKRQADIRKHQKENLSESTKKKKREAAKERQRQCRMRKKLAVTESEQAQSSSKVFEQSPSPYRVPQTYGKAVRKTLKALPKSPRKMKAVVSGSAKHVGLKLSQVMEDKVKPIDETETLVTNFFFRPDIVYTAPGLKDEMTIWVNGERKRVRKYFLTLHVKEAHFLFLEEYPDNPIGYSKFSSLRPQNVLFLKNTPADQCKCILHENFRMMLGGLGLQYNHHFWEELLCTQITSKNLQSDCWKNNCENCQNGARLTIETSKFTSESHVSWKLWKKHIETKRLELKHHESCAAELLNDIKTALPQFQEHVRVKRTQASAFENDKKNALVLQLDFAMNYACEWQGEVQSALWSRSSVTLFTAALFNEEKTPCYLIVSDTTDKSKNTVAVFLTNLLSVIPANNTSKLIIWTDGLSSEFKNRYMAYFLHELNLKFREKFHNISWKYTATSHGKGVVDGIGGSAKARVRAEVMARREIVQSSSDFSRVSAKVMPNITVISILQHRINEESEAIDWSKAREVKGIQSIYSIIFEDSKLYFYSDCGCKEPALIVKYLVLNNNQMSEVVGTGSFLLVKVAGRKRWQNFVCQVSIPEDENNDLTVSYLKKVSATSFPYVKNAKQYQVPRSDILKVLSMPTISDRLVLFNEPVDAHFG